MALKLRGFGQGLVLPHPEWQDSLAPVQIVYTSRTFNATLKLHHRTTSFYRYSFTLANLSADTLTDLLKLVEQSKQFNIRLQSEDPAFQMTGKFTNETVERVNEARGEFGTVTLTFEGSLS